MSEENRTLATEEDVKSGPLKKLSDLKTLREERGLTTEEIFLKTRINATILNAIENGEFHLLPAPASTKKFIQISLQPGFSIHFQCKWVERIVERC